MSRREKGLLSAAITDFDNTNIKFLSNKDTGKNSIEDLLHDWIDSRSRFKTENPKQTKNQTEDLKEKFMLRNDEEKEYRVSLIKNLNLEEKIKDDLLKDFILDSNLINDPKLKILEDAKNSVIKKMKIFVYLTVFYSFYAFAQVYDQRLNKFNSIQDLIKNKPRSYDVKYKHHFFAYTFFLGCLGLLYKQQKSIDNSYKVYMKSNYITLSDEDLQKYKVHLRL